MRTRERVCLFAILFAAVALQSRTVHGQLGPVDPTNQQPFFDDEEIELDVPENFNVSSGNPVNGGVGEEIIAEDIENDPIEYYIPAGGLGSTTFTVSTVNISGQYRALLYFQSDVVLDREVNPELQVIVFARDNINHGIPDRSATVTVTLGDINDNTPDPTNLPNSVSVLESTDSGQLIYTVTATDADKGKNAILNYRIANVVPSGNFIINIGGGQISLGMTLDYETHEQYVLTIVVEDLGSPSLSAESQLIVNVGDVNDNPPVFMQALYIAQVLENATTGDSVITVPARDGDTGIDDTIIYSFNSTVPLINGVPSFAINASTGEITVNSASLDREHIPNYAIVVKATEEHDPSMTTMVTVEIIVVDVNDNGPMFDSTQYNDSISELADPGSLVATLEARDMDVGVNAEFAFHFVNLLSNEKLPFNITSVKVADLVQASIILAEPLDYEKIQMYRFLVVATETATPERRNATTTVEITVGNKNDMIPMFQENIYRGNVSEVAPVDEFVIVVMATDADLGVYGNVRHSLVNTSSPFSINETTGVIRTTGLLNYEMTQSYTLSVIAMDSRPPGDTAVINSAQVTVEISVIDVNDNPPIIAVNGSTDISFVQVSVGEEQDPGQLVYVVVASDADSSPNNILSYSISLVIPPTSVSQFAFRVDEPNQLVTAESLDYETEEGYIITVVVSDGKFADSLVIQVNVVDSNDNSPEFNASTYMFALDENLSAGSYVGTVKASDKDSGQFGTVRYSISGVNSGDFVINDTTGVITTAIPLDADGSKQLYTLTVTARDQDPVSPRSDTAVLIVNVLDLNDNMPIFSPALYIENNIVENQLTVSIPLQASDADSGANAMISYSIIAGNHGSTFQIDSNGVIGRNASVFLDREAFPEFDMTVLAVDGGTPSLNSTARVIIRLQDKNDNSPVFSSINYNASIAENVMVGSTVIQLVADDPDAGTNSEVRYSLVSQVAIPFEINEGTGTVLTTGTFNYDQGGQREFSMQVNATDSGTNPRYSVTTLTVYILDVNDNPPVFGKSTYEVMAPEDLSGGGSILQVTANDEDSGKNSKLTYSIVDTTILPNSLLDDVDPSAINTTGLFNITSSDGTLFLSAGRNLDRETVTGYSVQVRAVDGGVPAQSGTTSIHVSVMDVNDNRPHFFKDEYTFNMSESSSIGNTFTALTGTVSDPDAGTNGAFTYSLSGTSYFAIDPSTGVLSLISLVNYETDKQLYFNVTATDGGTPSLSDTASVTVVVIDANDNSPRFPTTPYSEAVSIDEGNYPVDGRQLLTTLKATDDDSGEFGTVTYEITAGNVGTVFWINSTSGDLYVTGFLDRETTDSYTLTVTASDGGSPMLMASASVDVTVLDVNESPPEFSAANYTASVNENTDAGYSLIQVSATDPDLGSNAIVSYSLIGPNANQLSINSTNGVVSTAEVYNYEMAMNFTVMVAASDEGSPVKRSLTTITVLIHDTNDNKPVFTQLVYSSVSLPENMATGQSVAQVEASDSDSGLNAAITYTIANGQGKFSIDDNGVISLVASLDREDNDLYPLVITTTDGGQPRMSSSATLNISVTDINDNAPLFSQEFYDTYVSEDTLSGTLVLTVFASDADIGASGQIMFEITGGNLYNLFQIQTVSTGSGYEGRLSLVAKADYENETSFLLSITARDQGSPMLSGTAQALIRINNTNDNTPVFTQSAYTTSVSENFMPGNGILTLVANDADRDPFGTITSYAFAPGTDPFVTSNFTITTSGTVGTLVVIGNLDHEKQSVFQFSVVATDSVGTTGAAVTTGTAQVTVNVDNVNEGAPQFTSPIYRANVTEKRPPNEPVTTVVAMEQMDQGDTIVYSIVGDYSDLFAVGSSNGMITTKVALDREEKGSYILRIQATDTGTPPLSSMTQVEIDVLDVNDNSPLFPTGTYVFLVPENTATGTVIENINVAASDADIGTNAEINYSLSGADGVFSINSMTGAITLTSALNRESISNYTLNVTATDSGTPQPLSTSQLVTVIVTDSNDNPPVFTEPYYTASIPENTDAGESVLQVMAVDSDSGANAAVTYELERIDGIPFDEEPFTVKSNGLVLTNSRTLDREMRSFYRLIIKASDSGQPIMTSTVAVNVTVLDVNDNPPRFPAQPYSVEVQENNVGPNDMLVEVLLLRVTAQDDDMTGPNSTVQYSISDGDPMNIFRIDPPTGDLFAVGLLDFEGVKMYQLTVVATDSPTNPALTLSSSTNVTITLTDVNDNKPIFQSNPYFVSENHYAGFVLENATIGSTVMSVHATDVDTGVFGQVTYRFLTLGGLFSINETTGYITVSGTLNTETQPQVNLTVVARDGGSPPQQQNALVTIKVTGINDNSPTFPSSFYTNSIREDVEIGTVVRDLNAMDQDSSDSLVYSIVSGNNFSDFTINATSGEIIVDRKLDREFQETINLVVRASDGNESHDAMTTVQITLLDVNDNPPAFKENHYFTNITENVQAGAPVLVNNPIGAVTRIEATDADQQGTLNSLVTYKFIGPNSDILNIDPSTAIVTVSSGANLDYEVEREIDVTVEAYDRNGDADSLTSTVTLTIYVVDQNDVAPSFDQSDYSVELTENSDPGTTVATVSASDPDTGLGGTVNYFITGAIPLLAFENFEIEQTNGTVLLKNSIDREMTEQITLNIIARDGSTPFLSSSTTLSITITDINDNAPTFQMSHYFVSIPENLTLGELVIQVIASDPDASTNSIIDFSVIHNQPNNVFAMNGATGELSTLVPLDHETTSSYEVVVKACDRGSPDMLCSNATVVVDVTDINDETPTFDYDSFCVDICDTTINGTVVAQLVASDADSGNNGRVSYSISSSSLFSIYNNTGRIILAGSLAPSDTGMSFNVTVTATDGGNPSRSSSAVLQVNIRDCTGVLSFSESFYSATVLENTTVPAIIMTTPDLSTSGGVAPVMITLQPSSTVQPFSISNTGEISVTATLDKEDKDLYSLLVQATDGNSTTTCAIITVTVLNVNDNPPQFLLAPYFFNFEENRQNVIIGSTLAIDPDQSGMGGITYAILAPQSTCPSGTFTINSMNGTITAEKPLDREMTSQCTLLIEASDSDVFDPREARAVVTITVNDENDNTPSFDMSSYNMMVSESMPPNSIIVRVDADDADAGSNQQITYSIVSGNAGTFNIDSNSGTITTATTLDFETTKFYNLTVMARDGGSPSLSSSVPVLIVIEDYNDCTPQFTTNTFQREVFENAQLSTVIVDLNSTDCDSGQNGNVTYSIVTGNDGRFFLDPITGVLRIEMSLDYENTTSYLLEVRAVDHGSPALSSIAQITINVVDVNDETPVFSPNSYMFSVSEGVETSNNPVVGTVSATDKDSSSNGEIRFAIAQGNIGNVFDIDATSGEIHVINSLDRETTPHYSLFLTATDQGSPPRSANATVVVMVLDANDNNPIITNINSTTVATIEEGAPEDTLVFTVIAEDRDEGTNALIEFSLSSAESQDVFMIIQTNGSIFVHPDANIDYEERTSYTLTITVTDRGASPRTTSKELTVMVIDINDSPPQFDSNMITGELRENQNGVAILTLQATDRDGPGPNSEIQYFITNDETRLFTILNMNNTGIITNTQPLDREAITGVNLTVVASNINAAPQLNTTVTVAINILDANDNRPTLKQNEYTEIVSENTTSPTVVLVLEATDDDQPMTPNSEIVYNIEGIENIPFAFPVPAIGQLNLTDSLDREERDSYQFNVRVEDEGTPRQSSIVSVTVLVEDVNDNPPRFTEPSSYSVDVVEGPLTSTPLLLIDVNYTDPDIGINNVSEFSILSIRNQSTPLTDMSSTLVTINGDSGEVWLHGPLDYETTKNLIIQLAVNNTAPGYTQDCSGCLLSDVTTVTVNVRDINDNPPMFARSNFNGQVSTAVPTASRILQITANDRDSGSYGTVRYRLLRGSSTKFSLEESTGYILTRGTFVDDDGLTFMLNIEAYDNLGASPSLSSTATVNLLVLKDFRRILIIFDCQIDEITPAKEQIIVNTLQNVTGYQIVVEDRREHVLDDGEVNPNKTDVIFHAIDRNTGEIVDFTTFISRGNEETIFSEIIRQLRNCTPERITSLENVIVQPAWDTTMIIITIICFVLSIGAIVLMVMACQQRYLALHDKRGQLLADVFYGGGGVSLAEGLPRDFSDMEMQMQGGPVNENEIYVKPYNTWTGLDASGSPSTGDLSSVHQDNPLYEEQEIRMEMFEGSDDDTEGDVDEARLLAAALEDEDDEEEGSVTAI